MKWFHRTPDPIIIHAYGGYANAECMWLYARVLEDGGISFSKKDSLFRNLINTYKRFESDEISYAPVQIVWEKGELLVNANEEGYLEVEHPHVCPVVQAQTSWMKLELKLPDQLFQMESELMVPGTRSDFGVISDIDDTVIYTGVSSRMKWQLIVNSVARNVYQRHPIEGASPWYKKLQLGPSGNNANPFFYISNSPWNIYNYLRVFLEENAFPKGPILLRDIGLSAFSAKKMKERNKYRQICRILTAFPQLPFILIGDAAEEDTDIYLEVARLFPGRILTIYIRTVDHKARMARVAGLISQQTDVEILLVKSAEEAISHGRKKAFIQ